MHSCRLINDSSQSYRVLLFSGMVMAMLGPELTQVHCWGHGYVMWMEEERSWLANLFPQGTSRKHRKYAGGDLFKNSFSGRLGGSLG